MNDINSSKFLPYGRQTITDQDIKAVINALKSPLITQGPLVPEFEKEVSNIVQAKGSIAVNSGTSALHIACLALGLGQNDYLWTSPITFVASANCAIYCGAKVDFVDIDINTGLISITRLKEKLEIAKENGTLPKIIIPVHLAGNCCDMEEISKLANQYGFRVIEDASHAIGSKYKNQPIGNCKYSKATVFSFHPVKIITTGEGGLVTTNDSNLEQKLRELRSHGIVRDPSRFYYSASGPWIYEQQELGFNYRMSDIHAALGLSQLTRLDSIIRERNNQINIYKDLIKKLPVSLIKNPKYSYSSCHLAIVTLKEISHKKHRKIFEGLRSKGIGVQVHYSPVHLQPFYRKMGFTNGDFPQAESYSLQALSLPIYPGLKLVEQKRVIATLEDLLNK